MNVTETQKLEVEDRFDDFMKNQIEEIVGEYKEGKDEEKETK